jgi:dienelactone hydrolase
MKLACLVLLLHAGGFVGGAPGDVANRVAIEQAGFRTQPVAYPLGDVPAAYRAASALVPPGRHVVAYGESAGGTIAAWLAAHGRVNAAVTVGAPTDLRQWPPDPTVRTAIGLWPNPWRYSPARAYDRQRPLWAIHWSDDPLIPFAHAAALRGAHVETVWGVGHIALPAPIVRRAVTAACHAPIVAPVSRRQR